MDFIGDRFGPRGFYALQALLLLAVGCGPATNTSGYSLRKSTGESYVRPAGDRTVHIMDYRCDFQTTASTMREATVEELASVLRSTEDRLAKTTSDATVLVWCYFYVEGVELPWANAALRMRDDGTMVRQVWFTRSQVDAAHVGEYPCPDGTTELP